MDKFQFLFDTIEHCQQARTTLTYSSAFRHFLVGANRQEYFDKMSEGLEKDLEHLLSMSEPNWFFYMQFIDGRPILRENWSTYQTQLSEMKEKFDTIFSNFMQNVKTGMPDLPAEEDVKVAAKKKVVGKMIPRDEL